MIRTVAIALTLTLAGCSAKSPPSTMSLPTADSEADVASWQVLLQDWTGPYGGVPPFDQAKQEMFEPAILAAMEAQRAEIEAIASSTEPPTFENTVVPLEQAGQALERVLTVYGVWSATLSSPELREVQLAVAPKLAADDDITYQDGRLYERIRTIYEAREGLDPVQQRLVWLYSQRFQKAGAALDEQARGRVAAINQELSGLYTTFSNNLLADEEGYVLYLTTEEELAGLPDAYLAGAASAAKERGHEGEWAVTNTRSSMEPFLTHSARRDLREKVWRTYYARGDNGDERDNNELVSKILLLRAERAKLLGYENHAEYRLVDAMAKNPQNAMELLLKVWPLAKEKFAREVAAMQALADKEGDDLTIEAWDVRFYAEKVRKAEHDLDETQIQAYLQLEKLREGMFWAAGELYGWRFEQTTEVPVQHPDVRVWKVLNDDGSLRGLWYFDPYARAGKRSGAWMNAYRLQQKLGGEVVPIVSNNSNFVKGADGAPVLISWDDARTLFHEFGHAIHGLSSDVTYPSLAGTNVSRDYVEFPSQLNEYWLPTKEMLSKFAVHHETGEPLPAELVERMDAAANFNSGFGTTEYLASALIDMKLHLAGSTPVDADTFERETLAELGMPKEIVMRHRTPQFAHIFSGEGYSAGYYSYLWAETLSADAAAAFEEGEGFYDKAVAERLRAHVLSVGNTIDPAEAYRAFRGRDAEIDALMKDRGLVQ